MSINNSERSTQSSFGQLLKLLRTRAGLSQLELADKAHTTPRYISFLETGRSRPRREMVERISAALNTGQRESELLFANAGVPSQPFSYEIGARKKAPYLQTAQSILDNHLPYPACAVDTMSRIVMVNEAFNQFIPGLDNRTAEQSIDDFFGSQRMRNFVDNWAEVAWAFIDRRQLEAVRSGDPRLVELSERALSHMQGFERPPQMREPSMTLEVRFRVGDIIIPTNMVVMRYESVGNAALSELRLELFFPRDQQADQAFRQVIAKLADG